LIWSQPLHLIKVGEMKSFVQEEGLFTL